MNKLLPFAAAALVVAALSACDADSDVKAVDNPRVAQVAAPASTPQACVDALDAAESLIAGPVVDMADVTVDILDLLPRALDAGLEVDIAAVNEITADLDSITARADEATVLTSDILERYGDAADECRASVDDSNA